MLDDSLREQAQKRATDLFQQAGIALLPEEIKSIEILDFGLGELEISGAQIACIADTERIAIRLIALFPGQTEPEHYHPPREDGHTKHEVVRCAWGRVYVYGPGAPTPNPQVLPPEHRREHYTVWQEYILDPGQQVIFEPGDPHWFQAGPDGAVVWSFATQGTGQQSIFTDPNIVR